MGNSEKKEQRSEFYFGQKLAGLKKVECNLKIKK